jgi:protein-S-isoprenylcysteine O-methyltransferase Ste14
MRALVGRCSELRCFLLIGSHGNIAAVTAEGQPEQERGTAGVIAPPPVIYLAFLGLGFAFEWLMPGADLPGWVQWIGAVVIVAGVALMISFESAFKRVGTDANPYRPSMALATDGPYRFSRNPAYLGMAITYIGSRLRRRRRGRC